MSTLDCSSQRRHFSRHFNMDLSPSDNSVVLDWISPTKTRSPSTRQAQGKESKADPGTKACREKMRRDRLNDRCDRWLEVESERKFCNQREEHGEVKLELYENTGFYYNFDQNGFGGMARTKPWPKKNSLLHQQHFLN